MAIGTGNHPKALLPGVKSWWGKSYDEWKKEFPDLYEMDQSTGAWEEDVETTGFPIAPVKPPGVATVFADDLQGVVNRTIMYAIGLGYIVTHEELKDNKYEAVSKRRAQSLAFSMRQTVEVLGANQYNQGFTGGPTFGDGVSWFNSAHPTRSGNQSNILAVAANLSEAAIEDLCVQIMDAKNSIGNRISLMPMSLHISKENWYEANRILRSVLQNDTANNATNVLREVGEFPNGIKLSHYFSSATAWFIRTNAPRGALMYEREPISFEPDNDAVTKNALMLAYQRLGFGIGDWRGAYATPGV